MAQISQPRDAEWGNAREVLCVRLDTLGDVLMTGPAMRALKPGRRLTLLTSPAGAEIARLMPEVDRRIVYQAPWMKTSSSNADPAAGRAFIEKLRGERFDAAVIFTVYSQSPLPAALLCLLAEVPLRLASCRENPYALLTDWVRESEPQDQVRHEVRRQLDLVASVGASAVDERLQVSLLAAPREAVAGILASSGLGRERDWIVVHAGASAPSRRYPPELLARVCQILTEQHHLRLVFTGAAAEAALIAQVRAGLEDTSISLAGMLALDELAALLKAAPLLLSGNTGPVHVAAAVRTPVVDIYALTNPQHAPWQTPHIVLSHDVPCRWCYRSICPEGHHLCVRGVDPDAVVDATLRLLRDPGAFAPVQ
jgi:ADP-heptose:LPS heptosyltransferase